MKPIEYLALHTGKSEKTHRELDKFFAAVGYPGYKTSRVPWCAAAVGWSCIQAGYGDIIEAIPKANRLMARSWDVYEDDLARLGVRRIGGQEAITNGLAQPVDIVTYTRSNTSRNRKQLVSGHIDFFTSYDARKKRVYGLGGNESNKVRNGSSALNRVLSVYRLPESGSAPIATQPTEDKLVPLLPLLREHEGGFVNNPRDPGGPTNMGITIATFRSFIKRDGTVADLKAMTFEQAAVVYRAHYWDKVRGDDLPHGVDYAVFDFAVNSGPSRASKFLQKIVGVEQDGEIGPITLGATKSKDPATVSAALCDNRLAWMRTLRTWSTFKNGWTRRVKEVRAHSLVLARTKPKQTDRKDEMSVFLTGLATSLASRGIPKLIDMFTGKGVQSGGIGALLAGLFEGAASGTAVFNPVGDITNGDTSALVAAGVAALGILRQFVNGQKPADVTSIAMPSEPAEDGIDLSLPYNEDAVKEAIETVLEGKTMDDSAEDFAEAWARLAGGGIKDVSSALSFAIPFGAALYKRASENK